MTILWGDDGQPPKGPWGIRTSLAGAVVSRGEKLIGINQIEPASYIISRIGSTR
jgi:hypothetical protein